MEEPFPEMLATALASATVFESVTRVASASISDRRLTAVWEFLQADPARLAHLDPIPGKRNWHETFTERVFGSYREGLAITRYHLDRAALIERQITDLAHAHEAALFGSRNSTLGLSSRPLVAEYQAFEVSRRRTLEYLAGAVAAFFKTDGGRLRSLARTIRGRDPVAASAAASRRLESLDLTELIGDRAGNKSVRDRIIHHESVSPGVVNIGRGFDGKLWVRLHGEAEDLNQFPITARDKETLSEVLGSRIESVETLGLGLLADLGLTS